MYRKLILISAILLFDSKSHSQIDFAVIIASALVISHTMVRPIKGKFEDRLIVVGKFYLLTISNDRFC